MVLSLFVRFNVALHRIRQQLVFVFNRNFPPEDALCVAAPGIDRLPGGPPTFSIQDIIGDGFLWAVPKSRRSLEKRWKRKYGHPDYIMKIMKPRTDLQICNVCGDDHESGVLCPTCYKKVIDETKAMQEAIQSELKLQPVENEVVVLYEGEKDSKPEEFFEGKRVIEMKKARPSWFSKNLLQQSTQQPSQATDVKPTDLG